MYQIFSGDDFMKRILAIIFSIVILILCCACGSSKPTIEGEWYHIDTGNLYKFYEGGVLCDNNYVKLSNGKKLSGLYKTHENHYETYIKSILGTPKAMGKIYIIKYNDVLTISTTPDTSGKLLFSKSKETAYSLMLERKKQRELEEIKRKQKEEEEKLKALETAIKMTPVSYESIITGNHTDRLIAIEAIIDTIEYDKYWNEYSFTPYYWSNEQQTYVVGSMKEPLAIDKIPSQVAKILPTLKDGDKIKIVTKVYDDNSFGLMGTQYIEILSRGNIIDKSQKFLETSTYNSNTYGKHFKNYSSLGDISDISVTCTKDYIDGNKMYLKVYVKNNSSAMFKGDVHVFFYSADGKKRLGSDMIIIDKLMPGQTSWAKVKIDKYLGTPKIETEFTNPQFFDIIIWSFEEGRHDGKICRDDQLSRELRIY